MVRSRFGLLDQVESIPLETKKRLRKKYNSDEQSDNQSDKKYVETTYSDLKELRDKGKLIPGALYRITDYQCTTIQEGTRSAGHQFDIIVQAISESVLSEDAKAIQHEFKWPETGWSVDDSDYVSFDGDVIIDNVVYAKYIVDSYAYLINKNTPRFAGNVNNMDDYKYSFFYDYSWDYGWVSNRDNDDNSIAIVFKQDLRELSYFSNSNLAAWKLKYCLDNDEKRFAWAQDDKHILYLDFEGAEVTVDAEFRRTNVKHTVPYTSKSEEYYVWECISGSNQTLYTQDYNIHLGDMVYVADEDEEFTERHFITSNDLNNSTTLLHDGGKGVIYQMIDEHNNNCPYDFKNIQFLRSQGWHNEHTEWCEEVIGDDPDIDIYYYTFSWINRDNSVEDVSVVGKKDDARVLKYAENNIINVYRDDTTEYHLLYLNNIIFVSSFYVDDGFYTGTVDNVFRYGCMNCTFGDIINHNVFDSIFTNNVMGNQIFSNKSFGQVGNIYITNSINDMIIYHTNDTTYFREINDAFGNT